MAGSALTLRTTICLKDLANQLAYLLWESSARQPNIRQMDAHRFPGLSRAVNAVLLQHVGTCLVCSVPTSCDTWARTGGGIEVHPGKQAICSDHEKHLLAESGPELQHLLADLEHEISQFLFRHSAERAKFNHGFADFIHKVITESMAPYIYKNIAASCCLHQAA